MDGSNWRPSPQEHAATDGGDWRAQLQPDSRNRIINKIMDTLRRHLPCSGPDGIAELKKIAVKFEEKIYYSATSQTDYLRRISLKMLTMESKSQNTMANGMASNTTSMRNPQDPASQNLQSQVLSQGQQQSMMENLQNTIASAGMQTPASSSSSLQQGNGLSQNSVPNVVQNSSMQNISGVSQNNPMGNSLVQGATSNLFTNPQKQVQGRQVGNSQQQMQQNQSPQPYVYQQHLQQHLLKQKLNQNTQQQLVQPQMQQQQQTTQQQNNLLQSSQSQVMQNSSLMQPSMVSGLAQNQQSSSMQQPSQSVAQQQQQSALRQQPAQQTQQGSVIHHQQAHMSQQAMMPNQQRQQQQQPQHHLMGKQSTVPNMQQNQLIGQQNGIPDTQHPQHQRLHSTLGGLSGQPQNNSQNLQQQMMGQQNNLSNMHQQQIGSQGHVGTLPSQQQIHGGQSNSSSIPMTQYPLHMMQQSKALAQPQTPNAPGLLPGGGQQSQPQQQMMSQVQSQSAQQLQQQLGLQQQPNTLHNNIQQRLQPSNPLLHQQNLMDQQKMFQRPPMEGPSTSLDSTAETGNSGDWQEEVYQKIRALKETYFADLSHTHQNISMKLQSHDSVPQQTKVEQLEKLKMFKLMLERIMSFLQTNKSSILPQHKERLPSFEKQIIQVLQSGRSRKMQQGQIPGVTQSHQPQSQIPQSQSHESGMNPQLQSMNAPGSNVSAVPTSNPTHFHGPGASSSAISSSQQNIMSSLQPGSNLDPGLVNPPSSGSQQVSIGSIQQNPVSASQPGNINSMSSQSGVNNLLNTSVNPLHSNPYMLQAQHLKPQDQHMLPSQLKQQMHHRQIHQQMFQKQQMMQQQQAQQQHQQQQMHQMKQQPPGQMQGHQMPQLHQANDGTDLKIRQGMNLKSGLYPQHLSQGQRYPHQQQKSGATFPISSPQLLSAVSPQINQHSPQIDQQNAVPPLAKVCTPLQSTNSPFVVPSPSTPMAPSPMAGETEKPNIMAPSVPNSSIISHQQTLVALTSAPSLAIGTPGISASPLLAELSAPDNNQGNALASASGKSSVTEDPLRRLLKAVKSVSSKALCASVSDISSVVSMIDRIAGSAPGNGSRAAVGEDLVAMTKCRLQARNCITQDGNGGLKRMRRCTSAMPLNVASFLDSPTDSFKQVIIGSEGADLESTATSGVKRPRLEANPALLDEIREINDRLIDTVVAISDEDVDPTVAAAAAEGGEGTIVKCSYIAVSMSPSLKAQYAQMSPIQPLRLLVPANYPNCSPVLLDKFPVEISKEQDDFSVKARSRFSISLRTLSQPMSLKEIARTWDKCTRLVILDYATQTGGGTFSSKYGTWEKYQKTAAA